MKATLPGQSIGWIPTKNKVWLKPKPPFPWRLGPWARPTSWQFLTLQLLWLHVLDRSGWKWNWNWHHHHHHHHHHHDDDDDDDDDDFMTLWLYDFMTLWLYDFMTWLLDDLITSLLHYLIWYFNHHQMNQLGYSPRTNTDSSSWPPFRVIPVIPMVFLTSYQIWLLNHPEKMLLLKDHFYIHL